MSKLAKQMVKEFTRVERDFYIRAIEQSDGTPEGAAKLLGVSRSQFFRKVRVLDIRYSKKRTTTYILE